MKTSQEQERWEKNDQELKMLSVAIDAIKQKTDKKSSPTDDKFAALMEGQARLFSLLESKFEGSSKRQPVIHTLDQEETNLEWICQKERNRIEDDLDEFLEGFEPEISPLYMLQKAVQNGLIQSFKPTSTHEIYEKMGKGICDICDEYADSKHSHKGYSLLILHPDRKDELMAFVFHKERKEDVHEESVKVENMGQKVREPNICEDQLIDQKPKNQEDIAGKTALKFKEEIKDICEEPIKVLEENLKGKEEYPNMEEEKKIMCKLNKKLLQQNKEKCYKKNGMALGKRIIKKKPRMGKEKVKVKKKSRMYMRKRRIKKNKETMEKNNNGIKKIRRKTQERRNKKTRRIVDVQVCSGSGGGPGWRRRNQGKAEAPVEVADWRDISKSMVRKKLGFVRIKKLNGNGEKEGGSWAADFVSKRAAEFLKINWRKGQNILCPIPFAIGNNFNPFQNIFTPSSFNLLTLTHHYKTFNLKDTLTYLFGFISTPIVDGSRVEANWVPSYILPTLRTRCLIWRGVL